jgi:hydrogenase maturation protein HypF
MAGEPAPHERVRRRVRIEGIVQGVGFRPFAYAVATRLGLGGFVGNDSDGVFCEIEGEPSDVETFTEVIVRDTPPLASVQHVTSTAITAQGTSSFVIVASPPGHRHRTPIAPDTATCEDCLAEVFDPRDRRFGYPFTNCTNCGPRFTIVIQVPYDRPHTTMARFTLCDECVREYEDPTDRRFHAQPVCCPACGPHLRLVDAQERPLAADPLQVAVQMLRSGKVLAIKGLGGYHLAACAADEEAVATLRRRKQRDDKPFAIMAADLDAARGLCHVDPVEAQVLSNGRRPAVLLRRRDDALVAGDVAPGNRCLGVMLPYTPLHHLLARELGQAFVLTSGNISDEPIAYRDGEAFARLGGIADAFLTHDRPIHMRIDDSVTRVFRGAELPLRRARGHVPEPILLSRPLERPVLACGAQQKSTFCVAKGDRAFLSHHIGDLENYETLRSFAEGIEHFCGIFDVTPEIVVHDLHPEYLSTKYAIEHAHTELVGVQHHHAHIASCLAEHGRAGPVIGLALDGLGYGTDGTMWGGEVLVADLASFDRAGHLETVRMPGGVAAIREPWRMAAAWLDVAYKGAAPRLDVRARNADRWDDVVTVARAELHSPITSSMGRLFDAVAALIGIRDRATYEGQAAIELEQKADPHEHAPYPVTVDDAEPLIVRGTDLVRAVVEDHRAGVTPSRVAARFHAGVAAALVTACGRIRERTGLATVALSGGVFQNVLLADATAAGLEDHGFEVLAHRQVPPNDGGISLGQVAVAQAQALRRPS